jgi:hypothetical protein
MFFQDRKIQVFRLDFPGLAVDAVMVRIGFGKVHVVQDINHLFFA